ncbi:GAF domain-containing protein [Aquimarina sp. AD10]|uniref:histidine kinase n=1 Tax=Aquimarina aggregata TaxID=1642818 RepID=A0A163CNL6_9FLAO|nr:MULTISPECIES: GAF domain-containing sensor histidine kinase [Aquimarina]AXT59403.1 GAF domain-containing protein [Aquimarina sp. AD10]KZS42601.1 ATPase [Aquimarina aggregata]RKM92378.1 GAF domain-containing sensor histidine kinase [Aquimarina sp. AD10]
MISATIPINEEFRLEALRSLNILDTPSEKEFDEITSLAAFLCDTEIALISLVDSDRQWFKSKHGLDVCETPRDVSFCAHAILDPENPLIVEDARKDDRFKNNPLTTVEKLVIFYAGIPLVDKNGFALGTLCVIDSKPKTLSKKQLESLKSLANQVVMLFELNKKNTDLEKVQSKLKKRNDSLREFARVISHDLKMPLANIITTTDLLKLILNGKLDEESSEYFDYIKTSSFSMSSYISDVLDHYESDSLLQNKPEKFDLNELLQEIVDLLSIKPDFTINFPTANTIIESNKLVLKQVFFNLIANSIKYNDKEQIEISIDANEDENFYFFRITDNGMGIPNDKLDTIFDLFTTANTTDRSGNKGNGIGLSTVKKLVGKLGGSIKVTSTEKVQTTFDFYIKKYN